MVFLQNYSIVVGQSAKYVITCNSWNYIFLCSFSSGFSVLLLRLFIFFGLFVTLHSSYSFSHLQLAMKQDKSVQSYISQTVKRNIKQ